MTESDGVVAQAEACYERGEFHPVVEILVPWLESALDDARAWQVLGAAYFELQLYDLAEEATSRAMQLLPKSALAHSNWGTVLRKLGRHDEATTAQYQALRLAPGFRRACAELRKVKDAQALGGVASPAAFDLSPYDATEPPPEPVDESTAEEGLCRECGVPVALGRDLCTDCVGVQASAPVAVEAPPRRQDPKRFLALAGAVLAAVIVVGLVLTYGLPSWLAKSPPETPVSAPPPTSGAPSVAPGAPKSVLVEWMVDPYGISPDGSGKPHAGFKHIAVKVRITNQGYESVPVKPRSCKLN
ncbi:MAG TPA: tetratricopeptide repeat protein, partial [Armatimonadota bacterium]|nr:tetratricopeptide repeat protein [Armatimonadota bacterium]